MSENSTQFAAKEAFTYVDTYRSGIHKTAEILREEKEKLDKRLWEHEKVEPQLLAELRGLEHAINYVVRGEEPGMVALGESSGGESVVSAVELSECRDMVNRLSNERSRFDQKVKKLKDQSQEMQTEVIRARQYNQALQRRLTQSNSTFVVVVTTMFLVILVQLFLLYSR